MGIRWTKAVVSYTYGDYTIKRNKFGNWYVHYDGQRVHPAPSVNAAKQWVYEEIKRRDRANGKAQIQV